jgi:phosphoribosyl 1,2-cyclic phosphodiesterase
MQFLPIASGSGGNCYLLNHQLCAPLLIEAGVRLQQIRRGIEPYTLNQLAGCLVSHSHSDHAKSALELIERGVSVYCSERAHLLLNTPAYAMRGRRISPEYQHLIGAWRVASFDAVHDTPGTLGFVIDAPGPENERLVYLTDSAYCPHTIDGVTHWAIEANYSEEILRDRALSGSLHTSRYRRTHTTHMSIERVIEMLGANDLSRAQEIWLLHLSAENSDEEDFVKRVREATGVPTYAAPTLAPALRGGP